MAATRNHWIGIWLPPLLWMLCISLFSTDHFSGKQTSRFIGPILRWFDPEIGEATIAQIQFWIRKFGHLTEFILLWSLWYRAFLGGGAQLFRRWIPRAASWSLGICVLFASLDEWHQTWTRERTGSPFDVALDSAGAALMLFYVRTRSRNCVSIPTSPPQTP